MFGSLWEQEVGTTVELHGSILRSQRRLFRISRPDPQKGWWVGNHGPSLLDDYCLIIVTTVMIHSFFGVRRLHMVEGRAMAA